MARFLYKVSYTKEGMQGVMKEGGASRRTFIEKMAADIGGSIASFDFAFGDTDVYVIAEMPDEITAAAVATAVAASGAASIETVVLLSAEDIDRAIAKNVPYRAPGA
ncbi:MAG: GYD domain-containing protein [Actinomycetota bacterium]|nr:GYD domain-containing protein [Actinomycetota bacterium]MDH5224409.1 GYD domain-containing protein [Actinomycetota bacterium]MDH5312916.1 GYD domain-containing protein [Actinomycetota bacterium]